MNFYPLFICLLCIVPLAFQWIIIRTFRSTASDRSYHKLLINLIKENKHRPILKHTNLVNSHLQSYPQFLHILLSFLPDKAIEKFTRYFPLVITLMNLLLFLGIITHSEKMGMNQLKPDQYLLSLLFFVSFPYYYNISNAKNVGLSARGLGIFVGVTTIASTLVYVHSGELNYYFLAIVTGLLIYLSSQFATQLYLFVFPIAGLLLLNWQVLALPFFSLGLFFLLTPRLAYTSIKGQLTHKVLYYRYLAAKFILRYRESIWKDVVYVIPRQLFHALLRYKKDIPGFFRFITKDEYIRRNSLLIFIFEFTTLALTIGVSLNRERMHLSPGTAFMISCCLVFFITTFRKTRFLGEPERYLEFGLPFVAIYAAQLFPPIICVSLSLYSIVVILVSLPSLKRNSKEVSIDAFNPWLTEIKEFLLKGNPSHRLLCTLTEDTKLILDPKISQFYFWINAEKNDDFHFNDVFQESFEYISPGVIPKIVDFYKIDYILINKKSQVQYNLPSLFPNKKLGLIKQNINYNLYYIENNDSSRKPN